MILVHKPRRKKKKKNEFPFRFPLSFPRDSPLLGYIFQKSKCQSHIEAPVIGERRLRVGGKGGSRERSPATQRLLREFRVGGQGLGLGVWALGLRVSGLGLGYKV